MLILSIASSNATHIIIAKIIDDVTDEDDNDLLFATEDIGSHQTSNMEVDVICFTTYGRLEILVSFSSCVKLLGYVCC
jgi:hypothetical protein